MMEKTNLCIISSNPLLGRSEKLLKVVKTQIQEIYNGNK